MIHLIEIAPTAGAGAQASPAMEKMVELMRSISLRFGAPEETVETVTGSVGFFNHFPTRFITWLMAVEGDLPDGLPLSPYGVPLVAGSADGIAVWDDARPGSTPEPSRWLPDPQWDYRVLGGLTIQGSLRENKAVAYIDLMLAQDLLAQHADGTWHADPSHEELVREVQSSLWEAALRAAEQENRTQISAWPGAVATSQDDPRALIPATGQGAVLPGIDEEFLQSQGFTLHQVERSSILSLPVDQALLDEMVATSRAKAESRYDIVTWEGPTPAEWLPQILTIANHFDQEAPSSGFEPEVAQIDEERWRLSETKSAAMGNSELYSIAVERETGTVAGLTNFHVGADTPTSAFQDLTIVLKDHRGCRLGWWLKAHNLMELQRRFPERTSVTTWNASENDHMLAINNALGFTQSMMGTNWQKDLSQ